MNRRAWLLATGVVTLTPRTIGAQSARRVARVGWLGWAGDTSPTRSVPLDALRSGLAELGWKEGDNLVLEVRSGNRDQAAGLAAELVRANVDVIAAQGPMVIFARTHTGAVPLVFSINGDPVEAGLAAGLARPGGQLTGITALATALAGKRIELLKGALPSITRVAAIANDRHPGRRIEHLETQAAAERLGLKLSYYPVIAPADFGAAFAAIVRDEVSALVAYTDTLINGQAKAIAEFAARQRLPAISGWAEFAYAGNLMSYGPNYHDFFRQVAKYVDKLLRGARAADLPIEQPTRFELVVNLTAAQAIGLTIPQSLLLRADEVIQ